MVEHFEREGGCACSMELSDLLDSDTLEYCKHMTDANTSEGDQSFDKLMFAVYDSICEPLAANEHECMASEPTTTDPRPYSRTTITQPTPPLSLLHACANVTPNQPPCLCHINIVNSMYQHTRS